MKLDQLRKNWESLGRDDPMWAVLADPAQRGNQWDPAEFFATGVAELDGYLRNVAASGLTVGDRSALDFGCGAGRLTQALAPHFQEVVGVDISASMVDFARSQTGRLADLAGRVSFVVNPSDQLSGIADDSVDFVLSIVVLQHMNNDLKEGYIQEFVRVLRPGGIAAFTVPSRADFSASGLVRRLPNSVLNVYRRRRYGLSGVMEFHPLKRAAVEQAVSKAGGTVHTVLDDPMAGPPWQSFLFLVTKDG